MKHLQKMNESDMSNTYREGNLGYFDSHWSVYDYQTGDEYKVTKEQSRIFADDNLEFDDQQVLFKIVNGKAEVKLKPVTRYVRDLSNN